MNKTQPENMQLKPGLAWRVLATGLESRIPPVVLLVIAASMMWLASRNAPAFDFTLPASVVSSVSVVLMGALTCLAGVGSFRRARTTVDPRTPCSASALVASGIYDYSRNPMYSGFVLILLGWGLLLSNGLAFLLLPAFVLYMNRFQICPEERALLAKFGQDYREYCARVRRWL